MVISGNELNDRVGMVASEYEGSYEYVLGMVFTQEE